MKLEDYLNNSGTRPTGGLRFYKIKKTSYRIVKKGKDE